MRFHIAIAAIACLLSLAGCGGNGNSDGSPQFFTTQILSDPALDGDIGQALDGSLLVTQGMTSSVQSVFAGIDPNSGAEYRAFLSFPLTGSSGVPGRAHIDSAALEILLDDLQPSGGSLPIRIDLISFQPPALTGAEFDVASQPALATVHVSPNFIRADVGVATTIDVTPLVVEAQREGLVDFQIRIMEELGPAIPVLMEIDDSTGANRNSVAPLLTVTFD